MSSLNYMELCRLCLVKERVSIPIFEGEGDVRQIFLKIASCLPVKVARDDKLPKKICDDCMFKLDSAYQFWNTTANAEKQLLQWLGEVSNEDKKAVPSNTIETEQLVLKEEAVEQETSDITKTLSRVEAVLDDERGGSDDEDTESEEEGSNSEDSGDDEPPGKEEAESEEEEEEAFEPLEPTTFVNVSLAGSDEAGPSGIQQPAQTATSAQQQMAPPPSQQQQQVAPSTSSAVVAAAPVVAAPSASGSSGHYVWIMDPSAPMQTSPEEINYSHQAAMDPENEIPQTIEPTNTGLICCEFCNKPFVRPCDLKRHIVSHISGRPYHCNICLQNFKRKEDLKRHTDLHLKPKNFACDICDYSTIRKANLEIHMKRHNRDYRFKCEICGKGFYTATRMREHEAAHNGQKLHCELCGRAFMKRCNLVSHMRVHDPERISLNFCNLCGKVFQDNISFQTHQSTHMSTQELFKCGFCSNSYTSKRSLSLHYRSHPNVKPFVCNVCGEEYSKEWQLIEHELVHTKERKHRCAECGLCFSQRSALVKHMLLPHMKGPV